jgi:hypothetical protein
MSAEIRTEDLLQHTDQPATQEQGAYESNEQLDPLFDAVEASKLRDRWHALQARFVDDPRKTVQDADSLVAELLQELARNFSEARTSLEGQWDRGDYVSTEELRPSLQRYRSFFERLLAVQSVSAAAVIACA